MGCSAEDAGLQKLATSSARLGHTLSGDAILVMQAIIWLDYQFRFSLHLLS